MKLFLAKIYLAKIFFCENIFFKNIFGKNILGENIFDKNIFCENIFDPSLLTAHFPLPNIQPNPHLFFLSSSSVIFDVECDTTKQTHGPDGAMFVPFIYIDLGIDIYYLPINKKMLSHPRTRADSSIW